MACMPTQSTLWSSICILFTHLHSVEFGGNCRVASSSNGFTVSGLLHLAPSFCAQRFNAATEPQLVNARRIIQLSSVAVSGATPQKNRRRKQTPLRTVDPQSDEQRMAVEFMHQRAFIEQRVHLRCQMLPAAFYARPGPARVDLATDKQMLRMWNEWLRYRRATAAPILVLAPVRVEAPQWCTW